jgi:hypothetical protein
MMILYESGIRSPKLEFLLPGLGEFCTCRCNRVMRFILFFAVIILAVGCKFSEENKRWALSLDKSNRPITDCLQLNSDGFFAAAIAMNCQKSVVENMFLCSQGRMLNHYDKKDECDATYKQFKRDHGEYTLKSDPWEALVD